MKHLHQSDYFADPAFPLACWIDERHGDMEIHSHDFHELVLILNGRGRHLVCGHGHDLEAGDVFLIRGNMTHGYLHTDRMTLVNILFDPRRLRLPTAGLADVPGYRALFHLAQRAPAVRRHLRLPPDALTEAAALCAQLRGELERREPGYRFAALHHLMGLIAFLSRGAFHDPAAKRRPPRRLDELLRFVESHYRDTITIGRLVRLAGLSERSLAREFHGAAGCSPIEYVIRVRVAHAAEQLQRTDMRITEVAFDSGFNDSNYFARQFHRIMGVPPRDYRRRSAQRTGQ